MDGTGAISGSHDVIAALKTASARTGAEFDYLYRTALRESGLKTAAKAPTSSASGLFQFIEQTWLATFKEAGPRHGLTTFADDITKGSDGRYVVADPQARQEILALRDDPVVASVMAGELTRANRAELAAELGRAPSDGELYIGHFLGSAGAARLIRAAAYDSARPAAELFPAAASANRSIFYDRAGEARGAGEVYRILAARHSGAATAGGGGADPRETASPFAGIIAFFERLFAAPAPAEHAAPATPAQPLPAVAYGPQPAGFEHAGHAERLFALRGASRSYGAAHEAGTAWPAPEAAAGPRAEPGALWGGGLFTNMTRAPGPLVLIGGAPPR
jgi:hypothetical protein